MIKKIKEEPSFTCEVLGDVILTGISILILDNAYSFMVKAILWIMTEVGARL